MLIWLSGAGNVIREAVLCMGSPENLSMNTLLIIRRCLITDGSDSTYSVGYKMTPHRTRFQPGHSGNPKGRPKGTKNFATVIDEELRVPIEVTENGKRKRISKR